MKSSEEVAKILLDIKAITFNAQEPFRYTSGILSPVYTDLRLLMSYPTERKQVVSHYKKIIDVYGHPDVLAGTSTAGIPWAAWLAAESNLPMLYVRGKAKEHGRKKQVEGNLRKGQKVLIVEDLISTAKSSLATAEALAAEGGKVLGIIAIFDYTLPLSKENLATANIELTKLVTFPEIVDVAVSHELMSAKDKEIVLPWIQDPAGWGKKMGFE